MSVEGLKKIKIEELGGLCTQLAPADVPVGMSPDCLDVEFLPGSVRTRAGTEASFPVVTGTPSINGLAPFVPVTGDPLLVALGDDGQLLLGNTDQPSNPLTSITMLRNNSRLHAVTAYDALFFALSDGRGGRDLPYQMLWVES